MMNDEFVKRLVLSCVLTVAPGLAIAQAPAKPAAKPRADAPVGRLFFTPAQRAQLDVARNQRVRTTLSTEETSTEETATPAAQTITYGGIVRRSDGKSTIWINNRAVNDNEALGGTVLGKVRPDGAVTLELPQTGRSVDLKPGQSLELLSGTVEEGYSRKPPVTTPELKPKPPPKPLAETKGTSPASPDPARAEREREEQERERREQQRNEGAVSRAAGNSGR